MAPIPVIGALAYALNMIVLRRASGRQSPVSFQLDASLMAAVILMVVYAGSVALNGFGSGGLLSMPTWGLTAIAAGGALATVTFLMITYAFSKTEASILAPFQYLEIVGATLVGFAIFGEVLDGMTLLGTAIILASGGYVFHRERQRNLEVASSQRPKR